MGRSAENRQIERQKAKTPSDIRLKTITSVKYDTKKGLYAVAA